jgi:hypothetical protein
MSDHTHIAVLLDRTGSMSSIRDDVIGGFNGFLAAQQALPDPATMTLVQFDSQDPYEVLCARVSIAQVAGLTPATYVPRASTPLYDAIGRALTDLEADIERTALLDRPSKVVFVIVTDGQENSSSEFSRDRILSMIASKRAQGWEFVFLSADLSSFQDAAGLGISSSSRLLFRKNKKGSDGSWAAVSDKMAKLRSGESSSVSFDEDDRRRAAGDED